LGAIDTGTTNVKGDCCVLSDLRKQESGKEAIEQLDSRLRGNDNVIPYLRGFVIIDAGINKY
jgi:hypothetical protein